MAAVPPAPAPAPRLRIVAEGAVSIVAAAAAEGISISPKTALRWAIGGLRGVRLETVKIGGRRMTSVPALRRFLLATQDNPQPAAVGIDSAAADAVLGAHGLGRGGQ